MKNVIIFNLLFVMILGCKQGKNVNEKHVYEINTLDVSIKIDTINMDIIDTPLSIVKHSNKFYLLCAKIEIDSSHLLPLAEYSDCHFIISDKYGNITYRSPNIDSDIYHAHSEIYIRNDSIIIRSHSRQDKSLYFKPESFVMWRIINFMEQPLYEDENYRIFSPLAGNYYSNILYFKNKITGLTREGSTDNTFAINKLNGKYYITHYNSSKKNKPYSYIIEISDPEKLPLINLTAEEKAVIIQQEIDTLLQPVHTIILYTFVHKNQLLHICKDKENTYISKIKGNKLYKVFTFKNKINPYNPQQASDKYQIMLFREPHSNTYGYIEVTPEELYLHYINPTPNKQNQEGIRFPRR